MSPLTRLPVLLVDGQATGATPAHGHLIELAWARATAEPTSSPVSLHCRTIRLPPGAALPRRVGELTGLRSSDLAAGHAIESVWAEVFDAARAVAPHASAAPTVIHCARFEAGFFVPLHRRTLPREHFPLHTICTLEVARRLFPDIPRRGLRAMAGYFGHDTGPLRRTESHVRATAIVWHHLVAHLTGLGIQDLNALEAFLRRPPYRSKRRSYPMPRALRLRLPDAPGVYRLRRTSGDVLYVGKATSLKQRVNSYFQKQSDLSERMLELLSQARDVDVTPTATAVEAALIESDEIKRHDPPYNRALRVGDRQPWFASRHLELAPSATGRHSVGPLGSTWWVERLHALWRALDDDIGPEPRRTALHGALGIFAEVPTPSILEAGLAAFTARMSLRPRDVRQVIALGSARWAETKDARPSVEAPPDEPEGWTVQTVREGLENIVISVAHCLRRAVWLRRLSESSVAFAEGNRWHGLIIERGAVIERFDGKFGFELPAPPGASRSLKERRWSFDLATFDRLRVLTTELRRAAAEGAVNIRLGRGAPLCALRVHRLLTWV